MRSEIFKIVFEDPSILVVEKCQPFLSQRSDSAEKGSEGLYEFISRSLGFPLYPVHRLDREVLGLMVFAKSPAAAEDLSLQFKNREVAKTYEAWVKGRVFKDKDSLVHYLRKNPKTNYVTVFPRPTEGAKRAELEYQVLERFQDRTHLRIELKSGRSHQIRVQLAKIGHPILGDRRYGPPSKDSQTEIASEIALRAVRLGLHHPISKNYLEWEVNPLTRARVHP